MLATFFLLSCQDFALLSKDQFDKGINNSGSNNSTTGTGTIVALYNYPQSGTAGGDNNSRGFYITSYPGKTLSKITLWLSATTGYAGSYTIILTATNGSYSGTSIGSTTTTATLPVYSTEIPVDFDFGNISVSPGTTVAFTLSVSGTNTTCFFDVLGNYGSLTGSAIGVVETVGTTPPLDSINRYGISIIVYGSN